MTAMAPVILSALTFQHLSETPLTDQCNCACPDTDLIPPDRAPFSAAALRCAEAHSQPLPLEHTLTFNPRCGAGLAVLNASAKHVWEGYRTPKVEPLDRHDGLASTLLLQQMISHGLLEAAVAPSVQTRWGSPRTLDAWLHITNACNLRCDYCYLDKSRDDMSETVGRAAIDALIRSATRGGFKRIRVKFAGGEPSLKLPLVYALQAYANRAAQAAGLESDSVLLTNGVMLSQATLADLKSRGIRITVSLDGIGEWQDLQRRHPNGRGSFTEVNRTLDKLASYGCRPFVSITVTGRNARGLPDLAGFLLDRGLPFNFNLFRDNDHPRADDLAPGDDRVVEALEQALSVIESRLPPYSLLGSLLDRCALDRLHERTCGVGESYLVFDPYGGVAKCHMTIDDPVTDVFSDDPLADIKKDSRGLQNPDADTKDGCSHCDWKYWCAGGCPFVTYRATGRYDTRSPYCRIYKAIIPQVLRLEGLRLMKLAGLPL